MSKNKITPILGSLFLLCSLALLCLMQPINVEQSSIVFPDESVHEGQIPFKEKARRGVYTYLAAIRYDAFSLNFIKISCDDRIVSVLINGQLVDLQGRYDDLELDLSKHLQPGLNELRIITTNLGGDYGLAITPSWRDPKYFLLLMVTMASFCLATFGPLRRRGYEKTVILVIVLGFALRLFYWQVTPLDLRSYDVGVHHGHMQYVEYMAKHFQRPEINFGWQTYHPPLYYFLAAIPLKLMKLISPQLINAYCSVQLFSLVLSLAFVFAALALVRELLLRVDFVDDRYRRRLLLLAALLLAFWPSLIIHAVRVSNESLLYPLYAWGLYFLLRWAGQEQPGQNRFLYWSSLLGAATLATKTNGLVLVGLIVVAFLWRVCRHGLRDYIKAALFIGFILGGGVIANSYETIRLKLLGANNNVVCWNAGSLSGSLEVERTAYNYLYFDYKKYLREPFAHPWEDKGGRQYFWVYLLKTSIWGEFEVQGKWFRNVATLGNFVLLLMILHSCFAFARFDLVAVNGNGLMFVNLVMLLVSMFYFTASFPYACSSDFRYMIPGAISAVWFYLLGMIICHRRNSVFFEAIGYLLVIAQVILSFCYFGALILRG